MSASYSFTLESNNHNASLYIPHAMTISPPGLWLHPISLPSVPTTGSVFILTSQPLCQPLINPFHPYCQSQHRLVHIQIRAVEHVAENIITRQIHSCRAALANDTTKQWARTAQFVASLRSQWCPQLPLVYPE
ncbi:hypothetical protein I7I51_01193 [Histoplasma capsulatum]|uniref:Uncharacterized protein n=1 Tax=Ajellomyces capsulatus TaxID=5037 RepID=A0A8A1MG56_AJECA|nr:hypothetical protein I7I51_01193 [Histoplasma capsulatum]